MYGKYVFGDAWSIQGGRLPTLIGAETTFTFQNLNITRGLLFGQENAINQGVQVNYAQGPRTVSAAGTPGMTMDEQGGSVAPYGSTSADVRTRSGLDDDKLPTSCTPP